VSEDSSSKEIDFNKIKKGGVVIEIKKLESLVTQLALRGLTLNEIAEKTRLNVQSIKKLLETATKRLGLLIIANSEGRAP
jgi:DNA-binding CsgD family transcriptional regulator